jgi:hypothetical protein
MLQLRLYLQGRRTSSYGRLRRVALVRTDVVLSSPILVTLMMEALRSYETSVLTRATWPNILEGVILHSHRRENLKSYILLERVHRTTESHEIFHRIYREG